MKVQTACFMVNDPLLLPCLVAGHAQALEAIGLPRADMVGIGRYERPDEALVARLRGGSIPRPEYGRLLLVAAVHQAGPAAAAEQPFRYRNWLWLMAGESTPAAPSARQPLAIPTYIESNIRGDSVAELLFHKFLGYLHRRELLAGEELEPTALCKALLAALSHRQAWLGEEEADHSILTTDGYSLLGAALERPVHARLVEGISSCVHCGGDVDGGPIAHRHLRGMVLLDTDSLPPGQWQTIGPQRLFLVNSQLKLETHPLA